VQFDIKLLLQYVQGIPNVAIIRPITGKS